MGTMSNHPWCGLHRSFVRLTIPGPADWRTVWGLIVDDYWFQDQLAACAYKLAQRRSGHRESPDDVRQEAMTLLGRQLRKCSNLRIDQDRAALHFAQWMRGIV